MTKLILATVFSIISILVFVFFTKPQYGTIREKQALLERINTEIENANKALSKFDALSQAYNSISQEEKQKLATMIPVNSVDNIQLILDIEGIANQYNVLLEKVDISRAIRRNTTNKAPKNKVGINVGASSKQLVNRLEIGFTVDATYDDFIRFLLDLEHSLRIVDLVELNFQTDTKGQNTTQPVIQLNENNNLPKDERYKFNMVLRTYWIDDK